MYRGLSLTKLTCKFISRELTWMWTEHYQLHACIISYICAVVPRIINTSELYFANLIIHYLWTYLRVIRWLIYQKVFSLRMQNETKFRNCIMQTIVIEKSCTSMSSFVGRILCHFRTLFEFRNMDTAVQVCAKTSLIKKDCLKLKRSVEFRWVVTVRLIRELLCVC